MLKLYCYLEDMMEGRQLYEEPPFNHKFYLSDLMELLHINESSKIQAAFERALTVLESSGVPASEHIRIIYQNAGHDIKKDISLSPLGAQLIVINCDTANHYVAQAQLYIMESL